jgi:hypothetical protein
VGLSLSVMRLWWSMFTDIGTEYSRDELWEGVVSENDDPDDTTVRQAAVPDKYLLESLPV